MVWLDTLVSSPTTLYYLHSKLAGCEHFYISSYSFILVLHICLVHYKLSVIWSCYMYIQTQSWAQTQLSEKRIKIMTHT